MKGGKAILIVQAWGRKKKMYEIERVRLRVKKKVSEGRRKRGIRLKDRSMKRLKTQIDTARVKNEEGKK